MTNNSQCLAVVWRALSGGHGHCFWRGSVRPKLVSRGTALLVAAARRLPRVLDLAKDG